MPDFFWFSDAQWARIGPLLPTDTRGMARVDDRRVLSGIVHALSVNSKTSIVMYGRPRCCSLHDLADEIPERGQLLGAIGDHFVDDGFDFVLGILARPRPSTACHCHCDDATDALSCLYEVAVAQVLVARGWVSGIWSWVTKRLKLNAMLLHPCFVPGIFCGSGALLPRRIFAPPRPDRPVAPRGALFLRR